MERKFSVTPAMSVLPQKNICSLQTLSQNWSELTRDYRPSAFWFWNSKMNEDQIRQSMKAMAENDIREILIHPNHGMEVEYLSDEFFDRYRLSLELARSQGLKVWIYDEYAWPSGIAGGKLLLEHPEHIGWYMRFFKNSDGTTRVAPEKCDLVMDSAVGAPWAHGPRGYINMLSPQAVRCFIELTHERFYQECGEFFKDVVAGFFTDEPAVMMSSTTDGGVWNATGVPWSPEIPEMFKKTYGYAIEPHYKEFASNEFSKARKDYLNLIKHAHAQAYHGQIGRWCHEHGVKYIGHLGEDCFMLQVRYAGSAYQCLSEMDEPGVDMLLGTSSPHPEHRYCEQMVVSSIARHAGKQRVYCEAFGVAAPETTLDEMARRAQMLALHGINDIAIMGFQQSTDGIRKHIYWPPFFETAPWWPFYGEFKEVFARSVGLAGLGVPLNRYAVLYPQHQLEQTDVHEKAFTSENRVSTVIKRIGDAIYRAGETFEFIFPEMLDQLRLAGGKIESDFAAYDSIIVPTDLYYDPDNLQVLETLRGRGGRVLISSVAELEASIAKTKPSWENVLEIDASRPDDLRVFRFTYGDGELFAIRNVTDCTSEVLVQSEKHLHKWDCRRGRVIGCGRKLCYKLEPHDTLYVSVTDQSITNIVMEREIFQAAICEPWTIRLEWPNIAGLSKVQFQDAQGNWHDGRKITLPSCTHQTRPIVLPEVCRGQTSIPFRAEFSCNSIPKDLGLMFERDHLASLEVNGSPIDLGTAIEMPMWDMSCRFVDICHAARLSVNNVQGTLAFAAFETTLVNDAFFSFYKPMPSCDLFVAGSFKLCEEVILACEGKAVSMPLDLCKEGFGQYYGIIALDCTVVIGPDKVLQIGGIEVDLFSNDGLELLFDGESIGRCITKPYKFDLCNVPPGQHTFTLRLASTSVGLLGKQFNWGIRDVCLIYKEANRGFSK